MRTVFLLSLLVSAHTVFAQAPAPPGQPPAASRPPAATSRGGLTITVTDARGEPLEGIRVEVLGDSDRSGDSNASGQIAFRGMRAGAYRVRFSGDRVIAFEREIAVRAGRTVSADVTLNAAASAPPETAPAPPPAAPAAQAVGPVGRPQNMSIVDLVERELIGNNEARRDTLIACSGSTRTTIVQLNKEQEERQYDSAEITYYVVAGEGILRTGERELALGVSSFASLPRGTAHALVRRGRRPLIMLMTLSGAPCEEAR